MAEGPVDFAARSSQIGGRPVSLTRDSNQWVARFTAMSCPCEVLIEQAPASLAEQVAHVVAECAWRIEQKFSRYRNDNIVAEINSGNGRAIIVDEETANLLDFAATLHRLSDGRFDITSGVLRRIWTFDGGTHVPSQADIAAILQLVGWQKVEWRRPLLSMQPGMQIDLGGIGKEYAVDSACAAVESIAPGLSCLINFGGDVVVRNVRHDGQPWRVGVEHADQKGSATQIIPLLRGGLATSGDSHRFVMHDGHRYSHILDASTGWPVEGAPRSVSVLADTCTQAGTLTTLAMLRGAQAEHLLLSSGVRYWIQR
ncbi:MAG TPA: FAD:protein FMN transferase [Steroidobacteraceae bacterium]|nr:FAD:protein FMN transferase [Steroidobacteraceae bacterium]